jgi:hypothetical protein
VMVTSCSPAGTSAGAVPEMRWSGPTMTRVRISFMRWGLPLAVVLYTAMLREHRRSAVSWFGCVRQGSANVHWHQCHRVVAEDVYYFDRSYLLKTDSRWKRRNCGCGLNSARRGSTSLRSALINRETVSGTRSVAKRIVRSSSSDSNPRSNIQ